MDLFVKEINEDLGLIQWETTINCPNRKQVTFQLETYHPLESFIFECEIAKLPSDDEDREKAFTMNCKLIQDFYPIGMKNDNKTPGFQLLENDFEFPRKPFAVWIVIDSQNNYYLEKKSENWVLENIVFKFDDEPENLDNIDFNFVLWIQYQSSNRGERSTMRKLSYVFVHQIDCDVHFKVGEDQIGGHISILSAMNPVFAVMFKRHKKESQTRQVVIEDISKDIFEELLHYIYSNRLPTLLDERKAMLLFQAAHKYDVGNLMEGCVDYIIACCIRVDNVLQLTTWSDLYSITRLKEAALSFIARNANNVCEQDDWEDFIKNQPELSVFVTRYLMKLLPIP